MHARERPNARAFEAVEAALNGDVRRLKQIAMETAEEGHSAARRLFGESCDQDVT